jgi:hypothetical protein
MKIDYRLPVERRKGKVKACAGCRLPHLDRFDRQLISAAGQAVTTA